jgi:methionyl-tRNA formyltransferase
MSILYLGPNTPLVSWIKFQGEDVNWCNDEITGLAPKGVDFVVSYNYAYVLSQDFLRSVNYRAINLHTSLLPWNRGTHPNVWSFLRNTPKGVTIHCIDDELDTGDILYQKELFFDSEKLTLAETYNTLQTEVRTLFFDHWDELKLDHCPRFKQPCKFPLNKKEDLDRVILPSGWETTIEELKNANRC